MSSIDPPSEAPIRISSNDASDFSNASDASDRSIDSLAFAWPQAELDPVARMRALAAARPHVAANETLFDVPFDRLWSFVSDFENNTPRFEATVGRARILERSGDRLRLETRGPLPGPWMRFDVVLRPGWCLMRSKLGEIGMAARAEGEASTRFFHFEGSAMLGRVVRPLFAWNIKQDFKKLRALL